MKEKGIAIKKTLRKKKKKQTTQSIVNTNNS